MAREPCHAVNRRQQMRVHAMLVNAIPHHDSQATESHPNEMTSQATRVDLRPNFRPPGATHSREV